MKGRAKPRGFAAMDREAHQAAARKGGEATAASGKRYSFTSDKAREAALKMHAKRKGA